MKVTSKTKISELVDKYPEVIEVFIKNGMHCFGCAAAAFETIEEGCQAHRLDIHKLLKEIGGKIKSGKK